MARPRVLLADDHAMVLAGLSSLLDPEFELVGSARNGRELVELSRCLLPDVVVADISMPLLNGLDAVRRVKKSNPSVKIVFLTMHGDVDFATEAFRAGASGYLLKHSAAEELSTAIHEALQGRTYITPLIAKGVLASLMRQPATSGDGRTDLTPRQREVLQLVAEGRAIKEIATILGVSPRTVEFHKTNLGRVLGAQDYGRAHPLCHPEGPGIPVTRSLRTWVLATFFSNLRFSLVGTASFSAHNGNAGFAAATGSWDAETLSRQTETPSRFRSTQTGAATARHFSTPRRIALPSWISGAAVFALAGLVACGPSTSPPDDAAAPGASALSELAEASSAGEASDLGIAQVLTPAELGLPPEVPFLQVPWHGDLDAMVERRVIRLLTVFSRGYYFLDGPDQRGITYEAAQRFETLVNDRFDSGPLKVSVVILPVLRGQLLPALAAGFGDIAVGNLTITPERAQLVDFSDTLYPDVDEVIVTGPAGASLDSLDDLGGQTIHVRRSSSYFDSLTAFNERQRSAGAAAVSVVEAPDHLEDDDLMEMVNAGLLPMVVVDSHKAEFWAQIFENIVVRSDLVLRTGGQIAWALRKDTPQLRELVNEFVTDNRRGTLLGNIGLNRYLRDTDWVENSYVGPNLERFRETVTLFQRYGDEYEFDWLMLAAQGYQESRLDQSVLSRAEQN